MQTEAIQEILKDPSAVYESPLDVVNDDNLTLEQKREILRSWQDDIEALLRAAEENMPSPENAPTTSDQLALISKLRLKLEG